MKLVSSDISPIASQDCLYCIWKAVRCLFMQHNSVLALFKYWMHEVNLVRKIPLVKIKILLCSVYNRIYVSQISGPQLVARVLTSAVPSMSAMQLEGSPTAARAARMLSSYHSSSAVYVVFASKYSWWIIWAKIYVRYVAGTQKRPHCISFVSTVSRLWP